MRAGKHGDRGCRYGMIGVLSWDYMTDAEDFYDMPGGGVPMKPSHAFEFGT
jgi:hypothetical protein